MKNLIGTRDLESLDVLIARNAAVIVLQMHITGVVGNPEIAEFRAVAHYIFHAVVPVQRDECKPFADLTFLTGMYLLSFPWINNVVGAYDVAVRDNLRCL